VDRLALRNFRSGSTVQDLPEHPLYTESGTDEPAAKADSRVKD
jgi:hypothetical protein